VPPFLTPEGVTVIYGPGGVGKGYLALYLSLQLIRHNQRVTVVDFENHPREWGRRAHALGYDDAELEMAQYLSPFNPMWTMPRGSLADIAETIREELDDPQARTDYVVVDSFTTAASSEEALGGVRAAQEFFIGMARLGRPALVIAHVAGGQEKWPARPFGSVFVHNLARETWAVEQLGEQSNEEVEDEDRGPMTLELRQRKANSGVRAKPQFVTFTFSEGKIEVSMVRPMGRTISDMALSVLSRAPKPMTVKDLARAIKADEDSDVSEDVLRKTLARYPGRFKKTQDAPFKWQSNSES
jgi:hypothetical protein